MIYVEAPAEQDYSVIAGQTFYDSFTLKLDDMPIDLMNWKARLQGRRVATQTTPDIDLDETDGITLGGAAGTVVIKALPAVTRAWPIGPVAYQLEFEDAAGDVQPYLIGRITTEAEIVV